MIFALLIITSISFAQVLQDEVTSVEKKSFSFKEVCSSMVNFETPLIDAVSGTEIDCMGKKVDVGDFCDKAMAVDPYYLRGYVVKKSRKVICKSGRALSFKYDCSKATEAKICGQTPEQNCLYIKSKLARRLDLISSTFINDKDKKILHCTFKSLPLRKHSVPL